MIDLGRVGIWSGQLRTADLADAADAAAELEGLGYGAIWLPGREPDDLEERVRALLEPTARVVVATGIVSIWTHPAAETAALHARLAADFTGRFLLGVGVSHAPVVAGAGRRYRRPLVAMNEYLDRLDAAERPVPKSERVIAALAPRMLELARERAWGSHPYLVSPEHTRRARAILGPGALLAPEQKVVLETDPDSARAIARKALEPYLRLPNYVNNLLRTGFTREDVENGGSDRLVDGLVAWGDAETILERIGEHQAAGADHVSIQVVRDDRALPRAEWRRLASSLRAT